MTAAYAQTTSASPLTSTSLSLTQRAYRRPVLSVGFGTFVGYEILQICRVVGFGRLTGFRRENQNKALSKISVIFLFASYPSEASAGIKPESSVKSRVQRENQNKALI